MAASLTRPGGDPSQAEMPQPWEHWAGRAALHHLPDEINGQKVIVGPMPSNALTKCCDQARHDDCNHRLGGQCEGGVVLKLSLPGFLWRCGCPCHNDPMRAGRLF
jgi:hypothetical protein